MYKVTQSLTCFELYTHIADQPTNEPISIVDNPPGGWEKGVLLTKISHILRQRSVWVVDYQTAVQHLQKKELTLQDIGGAIRVVLLEDAAVLLLDEHATAVHQLPGRDGPALLDFRGQVDARGTQQERVHVAQRVARVEPPIIHYGRGDDLLSEFERIASETLDKVREENVNFMEVFN